MTAKLNEPLPGVVVLQWPVHRDRRGHFLEVFQADKLAAMGISASFVQDNVSRSRKGVLRGLHFQNPNPQGKLVVPLIGRIYDVIVDVRRATPGFGARAAVELDAEAGHVIWVPPGFAHGFQVISDEALVLYKVTDFWNVDAERTILWNDPTLDIIWPIVNPILSDKDAAAPRLEDVTSLPEI